MILPFGTPGPPFLHRTAALMKTHGDTGELTACGDRPCWVLDRSLIGTGLKNPIVSAVDHNNPHLAVWSTLQALEWGVDYVFACAAGDQHLQLTDPRTNACGSRAATALPTKRECGCSQQFASNAPSLRVVLTATGLLKLLRLEYGGLNVPVAYAAALAAHGVRAALRISRG